MCMESLSHNCTVRLAKHIIDILSVLCVRVASVCSLVTDLVLHPRVTHVSSGLSSGDRHYPHIHVAIRVSLFARAHINSWILMGPDHSFLMPIVHVRRPPLPLSMSLPTSDETRNTKSITLVTTQSCTPKLTRRARSTSDTHCDPHPVNRCLRRTGESRQRSKHSMPRLTNSPKRRSAWPNASYS